MDVTPTVAEGVPLVQRYGPAGFAIGGADYPGAVLISPAGVQVWNIREAMEITFEAFSPLISQKGEIEMILIGSGSRQLFIAPSLREQFRREGLILDCMDTGAACRTFNVLLTEGRRVAAALLPTGP